MSLISVDAALRMQLLIKNSALGSQQEVYNCAVCKCVIKGHIQAQSHLHGIKHQKAFSRSHFKGEGTQNATPPVNMNKQSQITSNSSIGIKQNIPNQYPNPHNSLASQNFRPQIPGRFPSKQNLFPFLSGRPQTPIRCTSTQNLLSILGERPRMPIRSTNTPNSIPLLGDRPQMPVRCTNTPNSLPFRENRPQMPARCGSTGNSIPLQGTRTQMPVRFINTQNFISSQVVRSQVPIRYPCTNHSNQSLGGRPQLPLRLPLTQNIITSVRGNPQIPARFANYQHSFQISQKPETSKLAYSQNSHKSFKTVKPKKSNLSTLVSTRKSKVSKVAKKKVSNSSKLSKVVKRKISNTSTKSLLKKKIKVAKIVIHKTANSQNAVPEAKEEKLVLSISLGVMKVSDDGNQYRCEICNKSQNGKKQALQHINAEPHQKKLRHDHKYKDLLLSTAIPSQESSNASSSKFKDTENSDDILEAGIETGLLIIIEIDDKKLIKCTACNKTCAGNVAMKQHITSQSHIKKISAKPSYENSLQGMNTKISAQSIPKLPEEIADVIVIAAHESLEKLFS